MTRAVTRRTAMSAGAVVLGGGAAAAAGIHLTTRPALAASFTAANQSATTPDGKIASVTIAPEGTLTWSGLDAEPETAEVTVDVHDSIEWHPVGSTTLDPTGLSGTANWQIPDSPGNSPRGSIDLTDGPLSDAHFGSDDDGESADTTVRLRVRASITAKRTHEAEADAEFVVTVTNEPADAGVGGRANTGINGGGR